MGPWPYFDVNILFEEMPVSYWKQDPVLPEGFWHYDECYYQGSADVEVVKDAMLHLRYF